jgi:hypothetical protein
VKIKFVLAGAVLASLAVVGTAVAANPKLKSFGDGEVTITGEDSATIANDAEEYGGVYLQSRSQSGKVIGDVDFSFNASGDTEGGAPRFSIPIDNDENGSVDGYAFLDVNNCGSQFVSTTNEDCITYFGAEAFFNWDAFAAAHPTYRIAPGAIPFIIADQPGQYSVTNIVLR